VAWWSPSFGAPTFLAVGSLVVGILSGIMWICQRPMSLRLPIAAGKWAWSGALCVGVQAIFMGVALSFFNDATGINVVYASRGLWVIAFVVLLGQALGNREHRETGRAFLWRVVGTVMLTGAIVIAVIDRAQGNST
ncbi:MAG: hypothetical protein AAF733_10225, partial [Verrucomicrobiota bacterium]